VPEPRGPVAHPGVGRARVPSRRRSPAIPGRSSGSCGNDIRLCFGRQVPPRRDDAEPKRGDRRVGGRDSLRRPARVGSVVDGLLSAPADLDAVVLTAPRFAEIGKEATRWPL